MVKAFTTNINGKIDIEFLTLAQETERKLKEIIQKYVKDCFDKEIDSCASDGYFLSIAAHELSMYRAKLIYEETRKQATNTQ